MGRVDQLPSWKLSYSNTGSQELVLTTTIKIVSFKRTFKNIYAIIFIFDLACFWRYFDQKQRVVRNFAFGTAQQRYSMHAM